MIFLAAWTREVLISYSSQLSSFLLSPPINELLAPLLRRLTRVLRRAIKDRMILKVFNIVLFSIFSTKPLVIGIY